MASKDESTDAAGAIAPPPFIFFGPLILGLALNAFFPLHFFPLGPLGPIFTLVPGLPTFIVGFIVGGYAFRALNRAHTSPVSSEPTSSLVSDGPFRYTRNPIYLSFGLIYLGATLAFNSLWAFVCCWRFSLRSTVDRFPERRDTWNANLGTSTSVTRQESDAGSEIIG